MAKIIIMEEKKMAKPTTLDAQKDIAGYFGIPEDAISKMRVMDPQCPIRNGSNGETFVDVEKMEKYLKEKRAEADSGGELRFPRVTYHRNSKTI